MKTPFELTATDRNFAAFILREAGGAPPPWLEIVVSLASNVVGTGNICLNLADIAGMEILVDGFDYRIPELGELEEQLTVSTVVGAPGEFSPLVLDGKARLYLYRYWN